MTNVSEEHGAKHVLPPFARADSKVRKIGAELVELLDRAGFQQARLEFRPMKPVACVCALGIK